MNRRTRPVVVISTAVICATVASASVYRAVKRIPVREVEVAHQFVVMSARPLPLGRRLEASDLKRVGWPASSPLPGAVTRIEDVAGRGLISAVRENEPITESKVAPREAGAGLSPAIPAGMRAISVKVNEVIGVAGFVVPGARVDLLATVRRPADALTRVLVANVPVLTAGTRYEQEQGRDAKPIPSTVVTLVVTPSQAEKIALAAAEGQITLMLRNPVDVEEPATPGARLARLVGDAETALPPAARAPSVEPRPIPGPSAVPVKAPPPVPAVSPPPPPPVYTVEAIRAGKRTQETLP
jgi:pilus assembly protein CpaB